MAVSLCATPAFANTITYDGNGENVTGVPDAVTKDSGVEWAAPTPPAREGYTFKGWSKTSNGEVLTSYTYDSGADVTFYAIWEKVPAAEATVTAIAVKTQPTKTTYTEGDALDLTGLEVTLTMSDKKEQVVALKDFAANKITATPADGTKLTTTNKTVTLKVEGVDDPATITITVQPKAEVVIEDETLKKELPTEDVTVGATLEADEKIVINTAEAETTISNDLKAAEETVAKLPETATAEEVKEKLSETFDVAKAPAIKKIDTSKKFTFSITVQKEGSKKEHSGTVNVEIPLPSMFKSAKNLLAIHYHGDKPRILPTIIKGGKVSFTLEGLSDVALVEYTPNESADDPTTPENPENPSTSDDRYVAYNPGGSSGGSGGGGGGGGFGPPSSGSPPPSSGVYSTKTKSLRPFKVKLNFPFLRST